ncbi:MAG TPA: MotA/TolQ/ExbB proton channel family protein [Planctomycetota bacterium]|nr:MotA/TolQ/ExbB proton channel family protein [Planctomycetota bacterium]
MKAIRMAAVALIAIAALGFLASPAFAQGTTEEPAKSWFDSYVSAGGAIGWVIVFCSFVGLALMIEHAVNIKRDKVVPPQLIDEIEGMFENEEYQEALELCEAEPNFLTNMLAAALPKINQGFETMKSAMADVGEEEAIKLQQKISYLSLVGNISPMLGLFGTVTGMISAFDTIARVGAAVTPADLATGIAVALVTTFQGLLVAIPCTIGFFIFRNKVVRVVLEINAIADEFVERFRGK